VGQKVPAKLHVCHRQLGSFCDFKVRHSAFFLWFPGSNGSVARAHFEMNPSYPEQAAPEWVTNSETEFEMLARAEHLRVIFKNSSITLLANLLGGSTLVVGLWPVVPHRQLLGCLASARMTGTGSGKE
jgi:hypothetical protein